MVAVIKGEDIEECLKVLSKSWVHVDPREIIDVVEKVMDSVAAARPGNGKDFKQDVEEKDFKQDIKELADYITVARDEIKSLKPNEINSVYLPVAHDELGAVVGATEHATLSIFEAVESIQDLVPRMDPDMAATVADAVTRVYEACSFQDITGQRVSKVVKALQRIEVKVTDLLKTFGEDPGTRTAKNKASPIIIDPTGPDADLLKGPQMLKESNTQAEIDAILASFD